MHSDAQKLAMFLADMYDKTGTLTETKGQELIEKYTSEAASDYERGQISGYVLGQAKLYRELAVELRNIARELPQPGFDWSRISVSFGFRF